MSPFCIGTRRSRVFTSKENVFFFTTWGAARRARRSRLGSRNQAGASEAGCSQALLLSRAGASESQAGAPARARRQLAAAQVAAGVANALAALPWLLPPALAALPRPRRPPAARTNPASAAVPAAPQPRRRPRPRSDDCTPSSTSCRGVWTASWRARGIRSDRGADVARGCARWSRHRPADGSAEDSPVELSLTRPASTQAGAPARA